VAVASTLLRRIAWGAAALATLALVSGALMNLYVSRSSRPYQIASANAVAPRDVAIVPGSSVFRGRPNLHLARRLQGALELYQQGRVQRILVSGNEDAGEVSAMSRWLMERGVRERDLLQDPNGVRTLETMRNAADRFDIRSAIISTQGLYLDRTLFLARESGIDALGIPAVAGRLRPSAPIYEAAKTALAFVEVYVLGRLEREREAAPAVAIAARLR
jgi:SanA protein